MIILITGVAGFIGSHLCEFLLNKGHFIVGIDNFDKFYDIKLKESNLKNIYQNINFVLYRDDIRDRVKMERIFAKHSIDIVIHLAAKAGVRPSIDAPEDYYSVNVNGTVSLLECMKSNNINKMIFASSSSVYGNNNNVPFSETDFTDYPISPYASTKKAGELLCYTYHSLYKFDIFCLRFFTVYGPRQRPDLAIHKFTNKILSNQQIEIYGKGDSARDYTNITDIINGINNSIERVRGYEIINLGGTKSISINKMITLLQKALQKNASITYLPMQLGDVNITCANISKARNILDYNPTINFETGIKDFVNWKISE